MESRYKREVKTNKARLIYDGFYKDHRRLIHSINLIAIEPNLSFQERILLIDELILK